MKHPRKARNPIPTLTHVVRSGDLLRYREGRGDPLVLLHGLGLTWRSWKPVLPSLTRDHDVLALDLPGFGSAPELERMPTVEALADAVEAELDAVGVGRAHVAGNSLGGWIALELGRRGRALSVVAFGPSGLETPPERAAVVGLNELLRARNVAAAPVASLLTSGPGTRSLMLGGLRARPWRVAAADAAAEIRDFAAAPGLHATLSATTGSRIPLGLDRIQVAVTIAFGTRDLMIGAVTAPRFAAMIPRADLVPLPGCGHVPMADDPDQVAALILERTAGEGAAVRGT